jgi:protein-disulfide isomerase
VRKVGWRAALDTAATIAIIAAAGTLIWQGYVGRPGTPPQRTNDQLPVPRAALSLEGALVKGGDGAKVVLVEFSDFQCAYCARFASETLPVLDREYVAAGTVKLAFRHLPLSIHPLAQRAAESAECAANQGYFWQMHDSLFARQDALDEASLEQRAADLRLNIEVYRECMRGQSAPKVKRDAVLAQALGVHGTPAFFFGTITADDHVKVVSTLAGARPVAEFKEKLDKLLSATVAER